MDAVDKTMEVGVRELRKHQVMLNREQWIKEAEGCEESGSLRTCEAIIKATIAMDTNLADGGGDEDEETLDLLMGDAEASEARGRVHTARSILAFALLHYPHRQSLWLAAVTLERTHGTPASLTSILSRAIDSCPQSEVLWLMAAKEKWVQGDVQGAREVLDRAFARVGMGGGGGSERVWLAAVKLEAENGEVGAARELLGRARSVVGSERVSGFVQFLLRFIVVARGLGWVGFRSFWSFGWLWARLESSFSFFYHFLAGVEGGCASGRCLGFDQPFETSSIREPGC